MKKIILFRRLCAVTMGLLFSAIWAMAQITVPSASNTDYVDFTSATLTNVTLDGGYSNKYGVGSMKSATASISLPDIVNETEKQYVLAFKARYNADNKNITVQIKFTDEESNEYSTEILTIDKNNCTRGIDSYYMLQLTNPLPVGNYTLNVELTSSNGSAGWGANFGNLLVLDPEKFTALPSQKIDFKNYTDKSSQGGTEKGFGNSDDNYQYGIGSFKNGSYIKVPIINTTVQDYVLTYLWKVGNANATNLNITLTKGDNTVALNQDFPIYNTSDKWHTAATSISNLEKGIYTMTITTTASDGGSWCPNVSNLAILPKDSWVAYETELSETIDLSKGLTTGSIKINDGKIESTQNGTTAVYLVNCEKAGEYNFLYEGATASGHTNSHVTVKICNADGNLAGEKTDLIIPHTENKWDNYNTYTIEKVSLTEGLNIVRLEFETSTNWCANLQNLKFTYVPYQLEISDNEDFAPLYDECASATYNTNITANSYRTICLPFAPDEESLSAYNFYELAASTINGDEGSVTFNMVNSPEANKPYIYSLKEGAEEGTPITGGATVNLTAAEAGTIEITGWQMVGSFKNETVDCEDKAVYALGENGEKLIKYTGTLTVPPYRAYIMGTSSEQYRLQRLTVRISTPTGIKQISASDVEGLLPATIYDLMGRPVQNPQKGHLYIQGGKKVIY